MAGGLIKDVQDVQGQLNPRDTVNVFFKLFDEQLPSVNSTCRVVTQNIGHAFIVGHPVNGIVGPALGVDGQQILIGSEGLEDEVLGIVVSDNNTFYEALRDTTYINADETTATINTTTFRVDF
jgi:hypothetical protein